MPYFARAVPVVVLVALCSSLAAAEIPELADRTGPSPELPVRTATGATKGAPGPARPVAFEPAPADTVRLGLSASTRRFGRDLDAWFAANPTQRGHVQLDRPLYRPGDTVSLRLWNVMTRGNRSSSVVTAVQLLDPRGTVQQSTSMGAEGTFALAADAPGGTWTVRMFEPDGTTVDRTFVVQRFEAPRVKKTLTFARDGYRPGDAGEVTLELERSTGERLAATTVTVRLQAEGVALPAFDVKTDAKGRVTIPFTVPGSLRRPDLLLTALVDDGGVSESISRPVPVVVDGVTIGVYPEGGDLVDGLTSRVYFEATDASGQPADITGQVVDDQGHAVATLGSWVDGRGHFTLTPKEGRSYSLVVGDTVVPVPGATDKGCVLRHLDDLDGAQDAVRVSVACTDNRNVVVMATQQEQLIDRAAIRVTRGRPTTVYLRSATPALADAQGVARVTVFDAELAPLAERLVYRNRDNALSVSVKPNKASYKPGDQVELTVRTTDPRGRAVAAEVALSVVDDALLAFADDRGLDLRARVLLQADLPEPIDGAAAWFANDNADGGLALDLALGTRGWRRFDWSPVYGFAQAQLEAQRLVEMPEMAYYAEEDMSDFDVGGAVMGGAGRGDGAKFDQPVVVSKATAAPASGPKRAERQYAPAAPPRDDAAAAVPGTGEAAEQEKDVADARVAVRSDFRDTIAWQPALHTGADGTVRVKFALSDAVAGFRATAEAAGGGWLGRGDALLSSRMPLHLEAKLPVELSAGDHLLVPVTLDNQLPETVRIGVTATVSDLLRVQRAAQPLSVASGERKTVYLPIDAAEGRGTADLKLVADAGAHSDAIVRQIPVAPRGFPVTITRAGRVEGRVSETIAVPEARNGSIVAHVTVMPTAVSELLEGVEGMVRMPGGCFEQTSSTNYPNVVALDWLRRSGKEKELGLDADAVLSQGYRLLSGYQVGSGGFETFGAGPGKEALSAFGLLEFTDMAKVYAVDPKLLDANVAYLLHQRNGKGGFETTGASSHGYGTAPANVLDAYITYALVETGHRDLGPELAAVAADARTSKDPYTLALEAMSLLRTRPDEGKAAIARLATLQAADGSYPGSETSITRSENQNLLVEATALSTLAMLEAGDVARADKAIQWFEKNRGEGGVWGATQGNALALKAIAAVAQAHAAPSVPSTLAVTVDGREVARTPIAVGRHDPIDVDLGRWLTPGEHTVSLALDHGSMPYTLELGWYTETPVSDPTRRVALTTSLADRDLAVGETTRLTAKLSNRTREIVPDPIARIGLPAGLEAQTWQLQQLVERGEIAFFETRPREVTLYWHGVGVDEVHTVALDLVAQVPGTFTGPASSAYPYYDDQAKAWVGGLPVSITP